MARPVQFQFRLYVAGDTLNSSQALANLKALCHTHLEGRHRIEVVNVFREPARALADSVFMTPALVRIKPSPALRIVGTLTDTATLLRALGIHQGE
jgi:circadian clock protein KaiB